MDRLAPAPKPASESPALAKPAPRAKPTKRGRLALSALAGLLVGWLLAELLLALMGGGVPVVEPIYLRRPDSAYCRSENPDLGFELRRNFRSDNADLHNSFPSTNSHGLRDYEREIAKPAGVRRILVLGDSVVAGHGVAEIDQLIPAQLQRQWPGQSIEVLNFGVGGYSTRAEVELLATRGLAFQPDLVILVFLGNDYQDFNRLARQMLERPAAIDWLWLHSRVFRLLAWRTDAFALRTEFDPHYREWTPAFDQATRRALGRLADLARDHRFGALVAIWPGFGDDEISDIWAVPGQREPLVVEPWAREAGLAVMRLAPRYRQDAESQGSTLNPRLRYTVGDTLHPSPTGCRIAAEGLAEYLEQRPEVWQPPPRLPESR